MSTQEIEKLLQREYAYGFVSDIDEDSLPPGLNEDVIRLISLKKNEPAFMLQWRLQAYHHWQQMQEPKWAHVHYPPINYDEIVYYSAPKKKDGPKSLDEVDPELLAMYDKLGIPLHEREALAGVAVDAVFDSVSVATTYKAKLAELGIIFCSFSEAAQNHPDLVQKYLGTVVPSTDNFFAALNSAVFSDGSFVYVPKGVRCPMELSTYFRINAAKTGQFERTLIIADEGALHLTIRTPENLKDKPYTVLIDDEVVSNYQKEWLLKTGEHHLSVISDDFRNESRSFVIEQAKTQELNIELQDTTPVIQIEAPENAKVLFDDQVISRLHQSILTEPGQHTIRFQVGDYSVMKQLTVEKGKTYRIALTIDIDVKEE